MKIYWIHKCPEWNTQFNYQHKGANKGNLTDIRNYSYPRSFSESMISFSILTIKNQCLYFIYKNKILI